MRTGNTGSSRTGTPEVARDPCKPVPQFPVPVTLGGRISITRARIGITLVRRIAVTLVRRIAVTLVPIALIRIRIPWIAVALIPRRSGLSLYQRRHQQTHSQ